MFHRFTTTLLLVLSCSSLYCPTAIADTSFPFTVSDYVDLRDPAAVDRLVLDEYVPKLNQFTKSGITLRSYSKEQRKHAHNILKFSTYKFNRPTTLPGFISTKAKPNLEVGETVFVKLHSRFGNSYVRARVGQYMVTFGTGVFLERTKISYDRKTFKRDKSKGKNKRTQSSTSGFKVYLPPYKGTEIDRQVVFAVTLEPTRIVCTIFSLADKVAAQAEWPIENAQAAPVSFSLLNKQMEAQQFCHMEAVAFGKLDTAGYTVRPMPQNVFDLFINDRKISKSPKATMARYTGPVEQSELAALEASFLTTPLYNFDRHFGNYKIALGLRWLYEQTQSLDVVDHLIAVANSLAESRNDKHPRLGLYFLDGYPTQRATDEMLPGWPSYRDVYWLEDTNRFATKFGIASLSGNVWLSRCADLIALTPELHSKTYNGNVAKYRGKTYKQISLDMTQMSLEAAKFMVTHYHKNPQANQYRAPFIDANPQYYISPPGAEERAGTVPYYNRLFPALISHAYLINALEAYDLEPEFASTLKSLLKGTMEQFQQYIHPYSTDGVQLVVHPYAAGVSAAEYQAHPKPTDTGHGSFELHGLMGLYEEGYFPEKWARKYADTMAVLHEGGGIYPGNFIKSDTDKRPSKKVYDRARGYIWLGRFQPKLTRILSKYYPATNFSQAYPYLRNRQEIANGLKPNDTVFGDLPE